MKRFFSQTVMVCLQVNYCMYFYIKCATKKYFSDIKHLSCLSTVLKKCDYMPPCDDYQCYVQLRELWMTMSLFTWVLTCKNLFFKEKEQQNLALLTTDDQVYTILIVKPSTSIRLKFWCLNIVTGFSFVNNVRFSISYI